MSEEVVATTKLSELNLAQLVQVFNMVTAQQADLVKQNQRIGQQIEALRAERMKLVADVRNYAANLEHLSVLIKAREAERNALERAAAADVSPTLADVLHLDGTAPGVVLEVHASGS